MPVIQSKSPPQKVTVGTGTNAKTLYTATKTTYDADSNGSIKAGTIKHELIVYPSATSTTGTVQATSTGNTTQWTPVSGSSLTTEQRNSLKSGKLNSTVNQQIQSAATTNGLSASKVATLIGKQSTATTNPDGSSDTNKQNGEENSQITDEQKEQAKEEAGSYKENTRTSYNSPEELYYPLSLAQESQDCVRFSILEYVPSLSDAAKGSSSTSGFASRSRAVTLESSKFPVVSGSKRLGTITLPIPGGISDSNSVSWQSGELGEIQKAFGQIAQQFISGGAEAAGTEAGKQAGKVDAANKSGELETAVTGFFTNLAVGGANVAGRIYGAKPNNNIEVLFDGPGLRTFSFRFLFSPRSEKEAKMVMRIIRAFKQSMSVKRSKTSLLLKAPRTFAISYTTSDNGKIVQHPYLNRFKECALTSCSVDYTPDGSYMTYWSKNADGRSMTSYALTLQFQELEPVFDDEYGEVDQNKDKFIGY